MRLALPWYQHQRDYKKGNYNQYSWRILKQKSLTKYKKIKFNNMLKRFYTKLSGILEYMDGLIYENESVNTLY
jgi:hypothetical protein